MNDETNPAASAISPEVEDEENDGVHSWTRASDNDLTNDDDNDEEEHVVMEGVDDLPIFASEANKQLHNVVKEKEARMEKISAELDEHKGRVSVMSEHLRNVQQELLHTQALVDAKTREIETEDHLKQLASREKGRYNQEIANINAEGSDIQDKLNIVQNSIFRGNEKMDKFKLQMNWNQEELEQWALAAKQKEEDNIALQKYTRADESKIKELNLQIEKLTKLVADKKQELDNEVTETQAKQIELDKTAEEFRQLHKERQQLVQQWQNAIEAMKRRDQEIATAGERFAAAKEQLEKANEELMNEAERLKNQEQDNHQREADKNLRDRQLAKAREDLQENSTRLVQFQDEVDVLKNELASGANELMRKRNENIVANKSMEDKRDALEAARRRFQAVKRKLDSDLANTDKVEAGAKEAESNLSEKETGLKKADLALSNLKEQMFKQSQELFALRQEEANLIAEISGAQAAGKNLGTKIHQLDQESLRQQELIYNAEFQIQQLERKVARASGERSQDEKKILNEKIAELQTELEQLHGQRSMLHTQCRKLGDELRANQRYCQESQKEQQDQDSKISELELENDSAEQNLRSATKEKEEVMVQHDVMRLEVRRLRDTLNARADEVFSLENRKFQLQMSMEERKKEIMVHREVQRAQVRASEEERHRVTVELAERTTRVEKLRAKYETLMKLSGGQDENNEKSQAFFVIQAAQRREELQREGDELDTNIRKCEREIRALENTLKHLTVRNSEYRTSFQRADLSSAEGKELRALEEQVKSMQDILFKRKKELQRLQTDYEEDQRRLGQVEEQAAHLKEHNEHLQSAHIQVQQELEQQKKRLGRSQRKLSKLQENLRAGSDREPVEQIHFNIQALQDTQSSVLYTLGQLSREFPEMNDSLNTMVQKAGLIFPSKPPSRVDVRPESARSDRSDRSLSSAGTEVPVREFVAPF